MTLNSPEIQLRLAEWQDELRGATGKPDLILMAYEPLRVDAGSARISMETIIHMVCEETGVEYSAVQAKTRKREVVITRQLICYFSKSQALCRPHHKTAEEKPYLAKKLGLSLSRLD